MYRIILIDLMLLGSALLFTKGSYAAAVVIANPASTASGDLSAIKRLYLGKEKSIEGGVANLPLDVDDKSSIRAEFLEKVVEKTETELRQYWSRLVFTGKASPPRNVGADTAVREWVARNRDAIGVIDSRSVDQSVKVLLSIK